VIYVTVGDQQLLAFLKEELNYENEGMKKLEKPKLDIFNQAVSKTYHQITSMLKLSNVMNSCSLVFAGSH
jgi:hypothetical protein